MSPRQPHRKPFIVPGARGTVDHSSSQTDTVYEDALREAERSFLVASVEWRDAVLQEWERLRPEFPTGLNEAINGPLAPIANALYCLAPDSVVANEETTLADLYNEEFHKLKLHLKWEIPHRLADLCREYAMAELRAYAALLDRQEVPPSRAVKRAEEHAEDTLREVHKRKWRLCMYRISSLFDVTPWIEEEWSVVANDILLFARGQLSTEIWFRDELESKALPAMTSVLQIVNQSPREIAIPTDSPEMRDEPIGRRLEDARLQADISHEEQAHRIGIARSTYFEVKAGRGRKKSLRKVELYLAQISVMGTDSD